MKTGLILDGPHRKDFSFEAVFGSATPEERKSLKRDTTGVDRPLQGPYNTCVACSVTFVVEYLEREHPNLSHKWLAEIARIGEKGATLRQVLEPARKTGIVRDSVEDSDASFEERLLDAVNHQLPGYFFVTDLSADGIYHALKDGPLIIGVRNYKGIGAHAIVAYDVTEDGQALRCANWHDGDQDVTVRFDEVAVAVAPKPLPLGVSKELAKIPMMTYLRQKAASLVRGANKWAIALLGAVLGLTGALYGAGYTPTTAYESRTTSFITAAATTIPVSSTLDRSGTQITMANLSSSSTPMVYLMIEPGTQTQQEIIACTGITSVSFTGCLRGLPFQGGSLTETAANAKTHNAASKVIITNVGQFFTEYVSRVGSQTIYGVKTFNDFPAVTSSAVLPTSGAQLATKAYADSLTVAGAAPSTTKGMALDSDSTLYINASSTASDNGGFLLFSTSTLPGQLFWDIRSFLAKAITVVGDWIFSGAVRFTGAVTSAGTLTVPTPTSTTDAVNKLYVDSRVGLSFYGDGSDGASTTAANLTLTRDVYYTDWTINNGVTVTTANYRIFVTGTLTNNGTISAAGVAGANGGNGSNDGSTPGTCGATSTAITSGSVPMSTTGVAGGCGQNAHTGNEGISVQRSVATTTASSGGAGGKGCNTSVSSNGGAAAAVGTNTESANRKPSNLTDAGNLFDIVSAASSTYPSTFYWFATAPGSSGGGSGGGLMSGAGGSAGGAGQFGYIAAKTLVNNGTITAVGGVGGNGGNGGVFNFEQWGGGGGGGGGGSGGAIILIYSTSTSGTVTVAGGTGGTGGTSGAVGGGTCPTTLLDGIAGTAGKNGTVYRITTNP
ncbi:MAG: hypothetical protein WC763_05230 [Candidatus Paceibacterota bacterium]|jgi:hypothetical protein